MSPRIGGVTPRVYGGPKGTANALATVARPPAGTGVAPVQRELEPLRTDRRAPAAACDRPGRTSPEAQAEDAEEAARLRARLANLLARLEAKQAKDRVQTPARRADSPKTERRPDAPV